MAFLSQPIATPRATAAGLIVSAFAFDTASTLAHGGAALANDWNPTLHHLSPGAYIAWSILRLTIALALLVHFWPRHPTLRPRWRNHRPGSILLLPGVFLSRWQDLVPALLLILAPLKLLSAVSNLRLLSSAARPLPLTPLVIVSLGAGLLLTNALFYWQHTLTREKPQ